MIDEIRLLLTLLPSCLGYYLVFDLFKNGFNLVVLISSVLCFVLAHYIKPDPRDDSDSNVVWNFIDFIVDVPFKMISIFLRTIGKHSKSDIDSFNL